jgi:hypothetical protein
VVSLFLKTRKQQDAYQVRSCEDRKTGRTEQAQDREPKEPALYLRSTDRRLAFDLNVVRLNHVSELRLSVA